MVRYSLLRLLVFFGCLAALWLAGLRDPGGEQVALVGLAAAASMVISFFVLKPYREEYSRQLAERITARTEHKAAVRPPGTDEDVEDDEGSADSPAEYR